MTNVASRPFGLAAIRVIMSVSTFTTADNLYTLQG